MELYKIIIVLIPMLLSLTVHEYSHALAAKWLGDDTATRLGRLTLNPVPHIDIFGTLLLPALSIGTGMPFFGWAKPVPTDPRNYNPKVNMKTGFMLVAIAGPISNILFGILSLGILKVVIVTEAIPLTQQVLTIFQMFIFINFGLAVFNLLPIPPLDGSRILMWLLPDHIAEKLEQNAMVFFFILIILIFTDTIQYISYPIIMIIRFFAGIFGLNLI